MINGEAVRKFDFDGFRLSLGWRKSDQRIDISPNEMGDKVGDCA